MGINFIENIKKQKEEDKQRLLKDRKLEEQAEYVEYLEDQNDGQQKDIRKLKQTVVELEKKLLTSDLDIAKANNKLESVEHQKELLENRVEYLEKAIKQYQELPDLKNMIENLQSLTTPSIDKLVEVMEHSNFGDFEETISEFKEKIDHIEHIAGQTEARTCRIDDAINHMYHTGARFYR